MTGAITFFWFDTGLPYLAHGSITMRRHVAYITTLTSDLKVKSTGFNTYSCPTRNFCLLWCWLTKFGTWVYHHERICCVHSWSWYDVDLCPQGQISEFMTWLCVLGIWVYYHGMMCLIYSLPLLDLDLWPQYQNYIFTMNLSLARSSLLFDIGISSFGILVYHHLCTFLTFLWPWLVTYVWVAGGSVVSFAHSYYLVWTEKYVTLHEFFYSI